MDCGAGAMDCGAAAMDCGAAAMDCGAAAMECGTTALECRAAAGHWRGAGRHRQVDRGRQAASGGSTLTVNGSSLARPLDLQLFANGVITDSTVGTVACATGADVACQGTVTKTSSTCGLCP